MMSLTDIEKAIQEITSTFDGSFSMKTPAGKYFFVNDYWLNGLKMQRSEVIGKTDAEIFPQQQATDTRKSDLQAIESRIPQEYEKTLVLGNTEINYVAIKWAFILPHGMPFCICTLADYIENKHKVLAQKDKIDEYLQVMAMSSDY